MNRLVCAVLLLSTSNAFAVGARNIGAANLENKQLWDIAIVVTGTVKRIHKLERNWFVAELEVNSLVSGNLDPGAVPEIRIGYAEAFFHGTIYPREGDKVIAICYRRSPGSVPENPAASKLDQGEFGLVIGNIDANDVTICGFSILAQRDERMDHENVEKRVAALQKKIRLVRAFK